MSSKMIRDCIVLLTWLCTVHGKEGYFWHINGIHWDPGYSIQGNSDGKCWSSQKNGAADLLNDRIPTAGLFGHYNCDSPWALIESAAKAMKANHADGIEFVLWTGDALARHESMSEESRLRYLKNITDLLSHTFPGQFVFPVLGHEEIGLNLSQIAHLWSNWLPDEALVTLKENGYYTMELRTKNYQIIALNTNLWLDPHQQESSRTPNGHGSTEKEPSELRQRKKTEAHNQWQWFKSVLLKARKKGKTIYIVGHTPPGVDDRELGMPGRFWLTQEHNARYLHLVNQYSDMIQGQFFGHWHSDSFRVIYNDNDQPVSWIMVAPSVTPHSPGGPNNPGLRLYKFDNDTGQVLDYTQYYLNLPEANSNKRANWRVEYNLKEHYELAEVTALSLHDLADRFTQPGNPAFSRYYGANRVSLPREVERIWGCGRSRFVGLHGLCSIQHYCAVTHLDEMRYGDCVHLHGSALASTASSTARPGVLPSLLLVLFVLLQVLFTLKR